MNTDYVLLTLITFLLCRSVRSNYMFTEGAPTELTSGNRDINVIQPNPCRYLYGCIRFTVGIYPGVSSRVYPVGCIRFTLGIYPGVSMRYVSIRVYLVHRKRTSVLVPFHQSSLISFALQLWVFPRFACFMPCNYRRFLYCLLTSLFVATQKMGVSDVTLPVPNCHIPDTTSQTHIVTGLYTNSTPILDI